MRRFGKLATGMVVLASGCLLSGAAVWGDDEDEKREVRREIIVRTAEDGGKHWLGVELGPVSETLMAQLDLGGGVVVRKVVPDSPAAKAGVKQHDVLLKFGEQDLTEIKDLLEAVRENEDGKTTLTVLRKGRRQTLDIQPAERPEGDLKLNLSGGQRDLRVVVDKWLNEYEGDGPKRGFRMGFVGPGVLAGRATKLPKIEGKLQVTINKEDDKPSKIKVKHNDKTWEVDEDDLEELPKDVRAHVERMLGHGQGPMPLRFKAFQTGDTVEVDGEAVRRWVGRVGDKLPKHFDEMRKQVQEIRRDIDAGSLEELKQEIKSLRREVEKLRRSPSDRDSQG